MFYMISVLRQYSTDGFSAMELFFAVSYSTMVVIKAAINDKIWYVSAFGKNLPLSKPILNYHFSRISGWIMFRYEKDLDEVIT